MQIGGLIHIIFTKFEYYKQYIMSYHIISNDYNSFLGIIFTPRLKHF